MLYSEAEPLVSFDRVCMGEGLYVEFFLLVLPVSSEHSPNFGIEEGLTVFRTTQTPFHIKMGFYQIFFFFLIISSGKTKFSMASRHL